MARLVPLAATRSCMAGPSRDWGSFAAIDAGFDHHLVKPPDLARLAELLVQVALDLRDDSVSSA